jgi:hypothetical protein
MGSRKSADEYTTSPEIVSVVHAVLKVIDLDPASNSVSNTVVGANLFYDKEDDGLKLEWFGNVYLNPPFSTPLVGMFCEKLCEEYFSGRVKEFIALTLLSPDTKWCKKLLRKEFTHGVGLRREAFMNNKLEWLPTEDGSPGHLRKSLLFTYGGKFPQRFEKAFSKAGLAYIPNFR